MSDSFFQQIYDLVARIPAGRVATYGQLALMAGYPRRARIVGYAMRRAPAELPCHRVVFQGGALCPDGGAFAWEELQRDMLRAEGVIFDETGRVDLSLCRWTGEDEG